MNHTYEVRRTGQGFAVRPAARPKAHGLGLLSRGILSLDLGRAVRLALALLLYILRLRLDSQMLSPQRAQQVRSDILNLIRTLTATDQEAAAESKAAPKPASRPAPQPQPYVRSLPDAPSNSIMLERMSEEALRQLSAAELQEFVRVAARDTKPMFERALMAVYCKQLVAMFVGPFSVQQETDDFNYPDFRLICRGDKVIVLRRGRRPAGGKNDAPDAYEMLRSYWHAHKRPNHFRIEQREGDLARELLLVGSPAKN